MSWTLLEKPASLYSPQYFSFIPGNLEKGIKWGNKSRSPLRRSYLGRIQIDCVDNDQSSSIGCETNPGEMALRIYQSDVGQHTFQTIFHSGIADTAILRRQISSGCFWR